MYPVGWPLWKLLARLGVPLRLTLVVHFDGEARVFWAESPNIAGLIVEAATLEQMHREAMSAADMHAGHATDHAPPAQVAPPPTT